MIRNTTNTGMIGCAGLVLITIVVGLVLLGAGANATESTSTTTAVTVDTACQMIGTTNIPHEANVPASNYRSEIGKTIIKTICNDAGGYAVYAIGYSNTELGRTEMLGQSSGRVIATGTATSGDTSNWAMKLTAVDGAYKPTIVSDTAGSFAGYHAIPSEYTKVATYDGITDDGALGSELETTYATYVASNQGPDEYIGKVKYTLVHPSNSTDTPCMGTYQINYNSNGGTGNMDSQTACVDRQIALLSNGFGAPSPTSENQFAAWNTAADGSGSTYYVGQSVANLASQDGTATLYAVWAPKYMQDLTLNMCSIVANERAIKVYDRRDGSDYTVRYINGACWMTQNLRITGVINRNNSNFSTYENFNSCVNDLTVGNSWDEPRCHDSGNTTNGVWYNYVAATAGMIKGTSNNIEATEDICPANWKLPDYDDSSIPGSIQSVTDSANIFSSVAGGDYRGGSPFDVNKGYWWSAKAINTLYRHSLASYGVDDLRTSSVQRNFGVYIRCVRAN